MTFRNGNISLQQEQEKMEALTIDGRDGSTKDKFNYFSVYIWELQNVIYMTH